MSTALAEIINWFTEDAVYPRPEATTEHQTPLQRLPQSRSLSGSTPGLHCLAGARSVRATRHGNKGSPNSTGADGWPFQRISNIAK